MSDKFIVRNVAVHKNFSSKEELLKVLNETKGHLSLLKKDRKTGEFLECNPKYNRVYELPNIKEVIIDEGYEVHTFDECFKIYKENFENDELYLPFDNNELYITKKFQ